MNSYNLTGEAYHQTIQDVHCIKELASALPANPTVVNIGACFGTSAMAIAEERADAFIFSIDVKASPKEVEHLQLAGLYQTGRVIRLLGRSQDIGRHWPFRVDMVYVDGSHIYKEVVEDIYTWLPTIEADGIICFHDYGKPICPGVKPAVDRFFDVDEAILFMDSMVAFRV